MSEVTKKVATGGLRSEVTIKLHSRQAQNVFNGRDKSDTKAAIIGLLRFSGATKQIFIDAQADDPWADWWLLRIDETLAACQQQLDKFDAELIAMFPQTPNINIQSVYSVAPLEKPLNFHNPYSYRMGFMIVEYDKFCCTVLGLRHIGLLTRPQSERYLHLAGKPVRAALASATGYRHQGVTRNDVVANNPKAQQATEMMGEVPQDVFEMKRRSEYAPDLNRYQDANSSKQVDQAEPTAAMTSSNA